MKKTVFVLWCLLMAFLVFPPMGTVASTLLGNRLELENHPLFAAVKALLAGTVTVLFRIAENSAEHFIR